MTEEQLRPFHNRIYDLIEFKMVNEYDESGELIDDYSKFDERREQLDEDAKEALRLCDSIEEYNASVIEDAIEQVLNDLRVELRRGWFNE